MGGVLLAGGGLYWGTGGVAHAAAAASAPRALQADLVIRQRQVTADGAPLGAAAPGIMLHVDRRLQSGHWKLTMTMTGVEKPVVTTPKGTTLLENPFVVARLEFDEDAGGAPVLYDRSGRQVTLPTTEQQRQLGVAASLRRTTWDPDVTSGQVAGAPPPAGGRTITTGLVAEAGLAPARRQRFLARYGRPVGRVHGLDRFLRSTGSQVEEALVTPDSSLPVEVNVARGGALASHVQVTYEAHPVAGFARRLVHSEQLSNAASGARIVTDVEMTNLVVDGGAR
jgi:hypothetical protein